MSNNDWFERGELPPVGINVFVNKTYKELGERLGDFEKREVKVISHFNFGGDIGVVVLHKTMGVGAFIFYKENKTFTPIKSEREKAIDSMLALDCHPQDGMLSRHDFCAALYDAGYRKVEV